MVPFNCLGLGSAPQPARKQRNQLAGLQHVMHPERCAVLGNNSPALTRSHSNNPFSPSPFQPLA